MFLDDYLYKLILILPAIFIAGFVDSISGGGGLISIPAYIAAGLPPHYALGTNKFSSSFGTLFATITYKKNRMIDLKVALISSFFALIGSFFGTKTVLFIDQIILKSLILFLIPIIMIFVLLNKNFGMQDSSEKIGKKKIMFYSSIAGLTIGFYDGFFGPGTGIFLIFFYSVFLKYDLRISNGNTKIVNLSSNIMALITFMLNGKVILFIGIPAAIAGILGNILGSIITVKKGNKLIRFFFVSTLMFLFFKILYDIFIKSLL